MLKAIPLAMFLAFGLALATPLSAFAENISVNESRPQPDEIKSKALTKAEAIQQKRIADLKIMQSMKENRKDLLEQQKPKSVTQSILLQYQMFEDAKVQKAMEQKIMHENYKKTENKNRLIWKLVNSGDIGTHEPKSIEYGRTK